MTRPQDIPASVWERADILRDQLREIADDTEFAARLIMAVEAPVTGITEDQSRLLKFYREFQTEHGHTPTYEEAARALGCVKSKVFNLLHQLEDRGVVMLSAGRARAVTILGRA